MALASKYATWPRTRIEDWREMVHVGDKVRYTNSDIDEVNILCAVTRKLPRLVVVEPVNGHHSSRSRTMAYTEAVATMVKV